MKICGLSNKEFKVTVIKKNSPSWRDKWMNKVRTSTKRKGSR